MLRLTSRKPLWLDLQPVDIKSRWRHNWKSAQVFNSHLVCDPTIRQPGFDLPRQQCWTVFARNRDTAVPAEGIGDLQTLICPNCGATQTMSHIVESCPMTKLNDGLSRLHCGWRRCFVADQLWFDHDIHTRKSEVPVWPASKFGVLGRNDPWMETFHKFLSKICARGVWGAQGP